MENFKLKGRRVLIDVPQRKESSIELSVKDEEYMLAEAMKLWTRLTVFAVGDTVDSVKPGQLVYVTTASLEHAEKVEINGQMKLMIIEGDVAIIWE
jgi:hypothetical protein